MNVISYLACPFQHKDPEVVRYRIQVANRVAAKLIEEGELIFSPVSHASAIHAKVNDWEYWKHMDIEILKISKKLYVVCMEGWTESVGVNAEINCAEGLGIPIIFLNIFGGVIPRV